MAIYNMTISNTALSTTADSVTLISAAARRIKIVEISISGMGVVSAANELLVARSTGGTTGGGALTAAPIAVDMPAAAFTNFTTWASQPTLSATSMLRLGCNANGGVYRWVARPGQEIEARNTEQISLRSAVGTSLVSIHIVVEEI